MNYDEVEHPHGINKTYVNLLVRYLIRRFSLGKSICKLLDVGAGTGDYWQTFQAMGILSIPSTWDLEGEWDSKVTCIFCKSVLEHIQDTQHFLSEAKRVLVMNGLAIFLVPDWNSQWKNFYDDSTHIRPFTKKGLEQAFKLVGFRDVQCEYFYQLPFTWRHRWLKWIIYILRLFPKSWSVHIRFSKERMLLLTARK